MIQSDSTFKILLITHTVLVQVRPVDIIPCFVLLASFVGVFAVVKVLQPANLSQPSLVFGTCADDYRSIKDVRQENVVDLMLRRHTVT